MAATDNRDFLISTIKKYADDNFGGDYKATFDSFDTDKDEALNDTEIRAMLVTLGIGNRLDRGMWVDGILTALDANKNGSIEWSEIEAALNS